MNNLLRNVLIRRSVYKFDPRPLRDEELMEILEEGKLRSDAANTVFGSMMLAAEKYAIGSCWLSAIPQFLATAGGQDIQNIISIPDGYEPLCAGAFGYRESERITDITSLDNIVNIVK